MTISFRQVAKFIWSYARNHRLTIAFLLTSVFFQAGLEITLPYLVGKLVDTITAVPRAEAFQTALPFLAMIGGVGATFWVTLRSTFIVYDHFFKIPVMSAAIRDSFTRVQKFSTEWHVNSFSGATVRKITRGFFAIDGFLSDIFLNLLPLIALTIGMVTFFIVKWGSLGIFLAGATVVFSTISIYLVLHFIGPSARAHARADTKIGSSLADTISCNPTVKIFGREKAEEQIIRRVVKKWKRAAFYNWLQHNWTGAVQGVTTTIIKIGVFGGAILLYSQNQISIGEVVAIFGFYNIFGSHIRSVGERIRTIQQAISDMSDIVEFSLMHFHVDDVKNAKELKVKKGEIEFRQVHFRYNNQKSAIFRELNLKLQANEKIAVVGHSGGGKTTFVKLLQRLYNLKDGEILIDGQDISKVTQRSLRRAIGMVPQEPILFHRTLAQNIAYGNPKASMREIREAAKLAHTHEFIQKMPQKYETLVGERGIKLSGGERQRVAIARAILADTPIVILDEATSSLDSVSEELIQDALKELMKNKTVIIVAHRLSTIKSADRILVFENGRIVEEGRHTQLLRKEDGRYRKLYELQAGGFIAE